MGSVPPTNQAEWLDVFESYKQYPEFQTRPIGFDLTDFKQIFYWEYLHRMIGRLIGLVFIIPFIYFLVKKKISGVFVWKLTILFALGAFQGFVGWFMVKSGLVNDPHVSHFRLALHLFTALLTFTYTWWLILECIYTDRNEHSFRKEQRLTAILLVLIFIQIIYGAFVAGLKSGLFYNTFPKMGEQWIADGVFALEPIYLNFLEGIAGVQFVHRYLGIFIVIYALYMFYQSKKNKLSDLLNQAVIYLLVVVLVQVILGIFTLILGVPLILAVLHQVGAFMMLMVLVYTIRVSKYSVGLTK
jgi:cytochrome c oxidase assembly protein subunit 15